MSLDDELLSDARALLDAVLEQARPLPDFDEVQQRARQLSGASPSPIPPTAPDAADAPDAPDRVESLWAAQGPREPAFDARQATELAEIHADARLLLDAMLDTPPVAPTSRGRRSWRRGPSRIAAAAAAVVFIVGTAALANNWRQRAAAEAELARFEAQAQTLAELAWTAEDRERPAFEPSFARYHVPLQTPPPPPPAPEVDEEAPPRAALGERLAQLDAEAYAHLRAGQRDQARKKFRTITRIGGRSEYAELAYGELFALARRGPEAELDKLWRAYLRRFPRGRYADAARAGLCRRTPTSIRRSCWIDYLEHHPRGAARSQALRETEG